MKTIALFLLAVILICGFSMSVTSCTDNNDNPVPAKKKKYRLVQRKEVYDNSDMYSIIDYGYDNQGRLASFYQVVYNSQIADIYVSADLTYTYDDHCIIEKHHDGYYIHYTLNNDGLIVKKEHISIKDGVPIPDDNPVYYQYNDGRMISYEEAESQHVEIFHWESGDLMYISYGEDDQEDDENKPEFIRSGLSVDHGYVNPPLSGMSSPLYMMGYYGKPSKHLESHYKTMTGGFISVLIEHDYTYTIADGHITEMVDNSHSYMKYGTTETSSEKRLLPPSPTRNIDWESSIS